MKKSPSQTPPPRLAESPCATDRGPRDFIVLSRQLLQLANQGVSRLQFLREVSRLLLSFTQCGRLELWLGDGPLSYRWSADGDGRTSFEATEDEQQGVDSLQRGVDPAVSRLIAAVLRGRVHELGPNVTDEGTWWTLDASKLRESLGETNRSSPDVDAVLGGSLALIPIDMDAQTRGLLLLASPQPGFFSAECIEVYEVIAQTLGMAVASRRAQAALRERVKEFTCLYGIAHVLEHSELTPPERLQQIVQLLPPAWQFPEIAAARIVLDERTFDAGEPQKMVHRQQAALVVTAAPRGMVEVGYVGEREEFAEGPFLREEQSLLEVIAREISHFVEREESKTQHALLEEQLRHADRLATIGQFAAGIAHEINEPLGGILGFAQLARKSAGVSQQATSDLDRIIAAALRAREIVRKLMLFARQTPPSKAPTNLNQVVEETVEFLRPRWTGQQLELVCECEPKLPELYADPLQLHQVAVNLIVNALQHTKGPGRITVRTRLAPGHRQDAGATQVAPGHRQDAGATQVAPGHRQDAGATQVGTAGATLAGAASGVQLIVEDTGEGIEPDVLPLIFNPFFTTKDIGEGTGLGLSVVHGIVTSHGGSIDVYSRPGQGSRFEITLPLNGAKSAEGNTDE